MLIMSNSIRLSKKYGLNPTIPICAFCGKHKNEIALLGHISKKHEHKTAWGGTSTTYESDIEAPSNVIIDYEPCDKCKAQWEQGVAIIEVSQTPLAEGQPPITSGAYPTGRFVVLKEEALNGNFKKGSKALMVTEEFHKMFCGGEKQ